MADFARLVLDADTRGLKRGERDLSGLSQQSRRTAGDVDRSSGGMARSFAKVGVAIGAAVAASGALSSVVSINASFGASMQKVAAISGATGAELDKLRQQAQEMGRTTEFSASQAADALGFLAMAGFSANEAMTALPSVLALATSGSMELAQAADIASNVLSGFGLEATEAQRASDVLASAASSTNTDVSQLGQAMSTAAPIAAALGVSMEEAAAAIGVMSDAGIQGERAGTALRGVFASLAGPTTQAQEALAKYGLTAADVDPQTVGLSNAMATLRERNISTADAMVIFGREAASGALVMAESSERMKDLTGQFENAEGAAEAMSAIMRDNLQGDLAALKSAAEGLTIAVGDSGTTGSMRSLVQVSTILINELTGVVGALEKTTVTSADTVRGFTILIGTVKDLSAGFSGLVGNIDITGGRLGWLFDKINMVLRPAQSLLNVLGVLGRSANNQDAVGLGSGPLTPISQIIANSRAGVVAVSDLGATVTDVTSTFTSGGGGAASLAGGVSRAGESARRASDDFGALRDRLLPTLAALNQYKADVALINAQGLSGDEASNLRGLARRLRRTGSLDAGEATVSVDEGPLKEADDVKTAAETITETFIAVREQAMESSKVVSESFAQMADRTLQAFDQMRNAIAGGGFFDILSGLLNFGIQLGSIGAFGKNIQTSINAAPTNRSQGGMAYAGKPYMVGERGPELFTPPGTGRIHSNDNSQGGSVHVTFGVDGGGNIVPFVDGRIATAAPALANAGAARAGSNAARSARRSVRR